MDDILKSAWGDLLNENEKLAALLEEKDARIERLEAENEHLRDSMMELAVQVRQLTEQIELHERAALAGKSHT